MKCLVLAKPRIAPSLFPEMISKICEQNGEEKNFRMREKETCKTRTLINIHEEIVNRVSQI